MALPVIGRFDWKRHGPVLAAFIGVVGALHWPLVTNLGTHVVGRSFEDVFEVLWQLRWMDRAVFELQTNPFYTPEVFHPQGWYLASGAQPPWYMLALAPATHLLGATAVYNLTALATLVLSGFGVYLVAQQYTRDRLAGLAAGCIYLTAPVLTLRLGGHWHTLAAAMFLPYVVWAFHRTLAQSPVSRGWLVGTAVFWALMILASWYFLFIGVLPVLAYAGGWLWINRGGEAVRYWRSKGTAVLGIGLLTILFIAPFVWLAWQANMEMFGERIHFSLTSSAGLGISPDMLFRPPSDHPIRQLIAHTSPEIWPEQDLVFIGFGAGLLALAGLIGWSKRAQLPLLLLGVTALILGMGVFVYWQGERVLVSWPLLGLFYERLGVEIVAENGRFPLPLPGLLLYLFLPFYDSIRVWARYAIALMVAVSVVAGLGAAELRRRWGWGTAVVLLFGLLVLWEGNIAPYNNFTAVAVHERQANEWLAAQPPGTVIYEYPDFANKIAVYSQSIYRQTVVNGYMSQYPAFFQAAVPALGRWPQPQAIPVLRAWGVDYVVVSGYDEGIFVDEIWQEIRALEGLCPVAEFDDGFMDFTLTAVFALRAEGEGCG